MGLEFRVLRKANEIAAFKVVLLGARLCGAPSFEVRHQASRSAFRFTVSTRHDWHLSVATDIMVFTLSLKQLDKSDFATSFADSAHQPCYYARYWQALSCPTALRTSPCQARYWTQTGSRTRQVAREWRGTGHPNSCKLTDSHSAGFWNGRGPRPEPIRSISRCRWRPSVSTAGLRINPKTLSSSTPMEQTYPGRRTALIDDFSLAAN